MKRIHISNRNSSFELLRIIAMLSIVISHCSVHGGFPTLNSCIPFNNYFLDWCILGNLGVDIFVMISGYYLCVKETKVQTFAKLLAQVWFFSYLCLIVYIITGNSVSIRDIVLSIFPTITAEYWFFTAYIILLFLSPYINLFIKNCTRKQLFYGKSFLLNQWSC